ncbi:hypothetical protein CHS0354_033393 [Potamilus streckersoni]|uniref:Uncharacterized protein n=1 Tax=Potamilus streckersoni TaxID=2493646 RepID=A0AAE0W135_9BIVA|nr:hypothetical protein CHS0354_033393 [Potamilus streckersoni]
MRNLTLLLLVLAVCAVAFSKGLRKRRSFTDDDEDKLNELIREIDNGNRDLNELFKNEDNTPNRRLWFRWPRIRWPIGKK